MTEAPLKIFSFDTKLPEHLRKQIDEIHKPPLQSNFQIDIKSHGKVRHPQSCRPEGLSQALIGSCWDMGTRTHVHMHA
eukprot:1160459-Pelagomonas_calceolata.AAC.7